MKKVYVIQSKSFFKDDRGIEYQIADYGDMPWIFTSLVRAKASMQKRKDTRINMFNERIVSECPDGRDSAPSLVQEFTTLNDKIDVRTVVSLWEVYTY